MQINMFAVLALKAQGWGAALIDLEGDEALIDPVIFIEKKDEESIFPAYVYGDKEDSWYTYEGTLSIAGPAFSLIAVRGHRKRSSCILDFTSKFPADAVRAVPPVISSVVDFFPDFKDAVKTIIRSFMTHRDWAVHISQMDEGNRRHKDSLYWRIFSLTIYHADKLGNELGWKFGRRDDTVRAIASILCKVIYRTLNSFQHEFYIGDTIVEANKEEYLWCQSLITEEEMFELERYAKQLLVHYWRK